MVFVGKLNVFFEVYCAETKMMFFFPTILCFKFRVIAQVILSKNILISDSSERFTFLRESCTLTAIEHPNN